MSRSLTTDLETETLAGTLRPILFMEGEFESGFLRFWTGLGTISWNALTWTGSGNVIAISAAEETAETRATGTTISLNGISSDIISTVLGEAVQGKPLKIWFGALASDGSIIADPYLWVWGRLDVPTIDDAGETCTVSVTVESELVILERAAERRYTPESHALDYDGDEFFSFVAQIQDRQIPWGRAG